MSQVEAKVECQYYSAGEGTLADMQNVYREMIRDYGGDVILWVWKPRHGIWLDQKRSYCAVKATWRG